MCVGESLLLLLLMSWMGSLELRSHDFTAWIEKELRDLIQGFEGQRMCVKMFVCVVSEMCV